MLKWVHFTKQGGVKKKTYLFQHQGPQCSPRSPPFLLSEGGGGVNLLPNFQKGRGGA